MFTTKHYVPILKWKRAEKIALQELSDSAKSCITPLIQFVMPKPSREAIRSKSSEEQYEEVVAKFGSEISDISSQLSKYWGDGAVFVDFSLLYETSLKVDSFRAVLDQASEVNISPIPVLNLCDNNALREAVVDLHKRYGCGLCLRITASDLRNSDFNKELQEFIDSNSVAPEEIDLLVDIKYINGDYGRYLDFLNLSQQILWLSRWRTFTFAGGSFPVDLSACKVDEENLLPRLEWSGWVKALSMESLVRKPSFSDYTIQHPVYTESLQFFTPSSSLKYTFKDSWLILRGKKGEFGQYLAHANLLSKDDDYFYGENFSFGDGYIAEKGQYFDEYIKDPTKKGTGTAETWLRAGINHHLECTVDQISKLS